MTLSKRSFVITATSAIVIIQCAFAMSAAAAVNHSTVAQWTLQVDKVDPGGLNVAPEFKVAIYENLLDELQKTKQFSVLRSGDRSGDAIQALLILKTTVEVYNAGSETKRAVTTITGATKLKVRSQLCTRDGQVVLERTVNGNVRFFGANLRATHNLARNVAKAVKDSNLPAPRPAVHEE